MNEILPFDLTWGWPHLPANIWISFSFLFLQKHDQFHPHLIYISGSASTVSKLTPTTEINNGVKKGYPLRSWIILAQLNNELLFTDTHSHWTRRCSLSFSKTFFGPGEKIYHSAPTLSQLCWWWCSCIMREAKRFTALAVLKEHRARLAFVLPFRLVLHIHYGAFSGTR